MILNTQQMLDATSRCEEWNDARTIEFMNTPPYTTIGEKSIQNFIDSIGVCDITYKDIFWIVNNNYLTKENRLDFCFDKLIEYAAILNIDFSNTESTFNYIKNNSSNCIPEIESLNLSCAIEMDNVLEIEKEVTCNYRLYKLIVILLNDIKNDSDLININNKICSILIDFYPEIYSYESILNDIVNLYE